MRARVLLLLTACATGADIFGAESGRLTLEISETAGVHRDHAPVHVLLRLPQSVPSSTSFRLLDHGRPVVAQFRPHGTETRESSWWLDFLASSAPFEKRVWQVEYGPDTEPVPERTTGHVLEQTDDAFVITNAPLSLIHI